MPVSLGIMDPRNPATVKMSSTVTISKADIPLPLDLPVWPDVLVVPWGTNAVKGAQRAAGLFDQNGDHIESAACNRWGDDNLTVKPDFDLTEEIESVPGRWLYGGMLYGHFGHFLCESTGRFWALDHVSEHVDGIFWLPKVFVGHPAKMVRPYAPFMAALGRKDLTLSAPQKPVRFAQVIIPEQGFGLGEMAAGRPQYRDFIRRNLGRDIPADGAEKLYVSRAGLPSKRGSVLLEEIIERRFAAEGYEVFRPETHPVAAQIARYKAAKWIVGLDGSALHLAAMVARPDARVAIINRGPSQNIDDYSRQFHHFSGISVLQIEAIMAYWFHQGRRLVRRETHALLDFAKLSNLLFTNGFIQSQSWAQPSETDLSAAIAEREAHFGNPLQRHEMERK